MGLGAVVAYHGTPLTPNPLLEALCRTEAGAGVERHFCVSYYRPDQVALVDAIAASYFLDNGAFSAWQAARRSGREVLFDSAYWGAYYEFVRTWLASRASWFVIPDVIMAGTQEQDALIRECPAELLPFGVPVWHMDEPIGRLLSLIERFERVAIGAVPPYGVVGSPAWRERMDEVWGEIDATFGRVPMIHMLRGMRCLGRGYPYPFFSVDSADVARNHNRLKDPDGLDFGHLWATRQKIDRWDMLASRRVIPDRWRPPGPLRTALPGALLPGLPAAPREAGGSSSPALARE